MAINRLAAWLIAIRPTGQRRRRVAPISAMARRLLSPGSTAPGWGRRREEVRRPLGEEVGSSPAQGDDGSHPGRHRLEAKWRALAIEKVLLHIAGQVDRFPANNSNPGVMSGITKLVRHADHNVRTIRFVFGGYDPLLAPERARMTGSKEAALRASRDGWHVEHDWRSRAVAYQVKLRMLHGGSRHRVVGTRLGILGHRGLSPSLGLGRCAMVPGAAKGRRRRTTEVNGERC